MEKSQLDLCQRVLKKLYKAGVLDTVIIIGSWALYFYKFYFKKNTYTPDIRTRDIDFLVPLPPKYQGKTDIPKMLEEMEFIISFKGEGGYIMLDHPKLVVEFLIPEIGRGSDKPYPLPNLGLNAQPLRYLNFLTEHTITINYKDMNLILPHPAAHALHKIIISGRRKIKDKAEKDRIQAINLLSFITQKQGTTNEVKTIFNSMHPKWQKNVLNNLEKFGEKEFIDILR